MKKFSRVLALVLIIAALGLSACSSSGADSSDANNEQSPTIEDNQNNEQPDTQPEDYPDYEAEIDWSLYPIIIDQRIGVTANWHTVDGEDFPTHIPLLPVADALEVEVVLDDSDPQTVTLEGLRGVITFTVGSNDFNVDGESIELWQPSLLLGSEIYVPISFFRDVYGMGGAAWMSGHVYLDTHATGDMH